MVTRYTAYWCETTHSYWTEDQLVESKTPVLGTSVERVRISSENPVGKIVHAVLRQRPKSLYISISHQDESYGYNIFEAQQVDQHDGNTSPWITLRSASPEHVLSSLRNLLTAFEYGRHIAYTELSRHSK